MSSDLINSNTLDIIFEKCKHKLVLNNILNNSNTSPKLYKTIKEFINNESVE